MLPVQEVFRNSLIGWAYELACRMSLLSPARPVAIKGKAYLRSSLPHRL